MSQGGVRTNQTFRKGDPQIEVRLKSYKLDNCLSFKNKRSGNSAFASRACGTSSADRSRREERRRSAPSPRPHSAGGAQKPCTSGHKRCNSRRRVSVTASNHSLPLLVSILQFRRLACVRTTRRFHEPIGTGFLAAAASIYSSEQKADMLEARCRRAVEARRTLRRADGPEERECPAAKLKAGGHPGRCPTGSESRRRRFQRP